MDALVWGAAALALLFFAAFARAPASGLKSGIKTGSVALLAGHALVSGGPGVALALALGALGDFCLSRDGARWFVAGMAAFGAAHLVYLSLMLPAAQWPVHWPATLALLVFGFAMARALWPATGTLRGPVMAYVAVILAMGCVALALPGGTWAWVTWAALAFVASDAVLAVELFLMRGNHRLSTILPLAVWPLYWLAQLGLCLGLLAAV